MEPNPTAADQLAEMLVLKEEIAVALREHDYLRDHIYKPGGLADEFRALKAERDALRERLDSVASMAEEWAETTGAANAGLFQTIALLARGKPPVAGGEG